MKQNTIIRLAVVALGLLLIAGLAQTSFAQWSNDPNISAPISTTSYEKEGLSAVSDGAGGIISAWAERRTDGTRPLVAQRLGSGGTRLWVTDVTWGASEVNSPLVITIHMVSDQAGGAIILAEEKFYGMSFNKLQRINSLGVPLWGNTGWLYEYYGLISDGAGGAILVGRGSSSNFRMYVRRVNAAGSEVWSVPISPVDSVSRWGKIIGDGSGGAIVMYAVGFDNSDIYAQRISAAGVVQWPANGVPIAVVPGNQWGPLVTPDGTGGAFVAWNDERAGLNDRNVYVQRINGAGVVQWTVNGIYVASASNASYPNCRSIVPDGSGGVVLGWSESRSCGLTSGSAQRLSSSGALIWPSGGIDLTGCGGYNPDVIYDGAGGFVAVWGKWNGAFNDIYAQRFSAIGARQWAPNGVPVSTYQMFNMHVTPVLDGRGGVIVPLTLENMYGFAFSLNAQRLNLDGTLGSPNLIANGQFEQGTANWTMYSAAPNGISFSTVAGGPSGSYAKVHINRTSNNMQFYQTYFPLTAGKRYTLSFDAYSPTARQVHVGVMKHSSNPAYYYGLNPYVQLTAGWRHYEFPFTAGGFAGTTNDTRLRFYFVYLCQAGDNYYFDNVSLAQVLAKAGEEQIAEQPTTFLLEQNFPNPFNPTTTIRFQIPNDGHVSLKVFDVLGREVKTLVDEVRIFGAYEEIFDATSLASGIYFYRLETGSFAQSKKMLIMK